MHVRELIELSSAIVTNASELITCQPRLAARAMESYWVQSKVRSDHWTKAINDYSRACVAGSVTERAVAWQQIRPVLEEILASEILTRVWCATICHVDNGPTRGEFAPIARSVLMSHHESRNRALNTMVYGQGSTLSDAVTLNRLRRRVEKWNDVLIGGLLVQFDSRAYAFDVNRAQAYAKELTDEQRDLRQCAAWESLRTSLTAAFQTGISLLAVSNNANRAIAVSVMNGLPANWFDGPNVAHSLWLERLDHTAQNAVGLVAEALAEGFSPSEAIVRFDGLENGLRAPKY
jgi:hypothetical protein